ncbi:OLC1v1024412C1 [Oldenlandia corymbosa var. corymbosa]|uniref:OLC1v1024412C1 n=1 Tax=Oldenlandia corymbosa var. corymbosa TaxID=529605 RepID=A0AAV1C3M9_OLDCO|nr:OLC1v1024412C1 [Oldenlandia corymbosa var. corymbosa]
MIKSETSKLAGKVVDLFCASMFDVAKEFGVPHYLFLTCGASALGLMSHLQSLRDDHNLDVTDIKVSDDSTEIDVPAYFNPVPTKVLPSVLLDKGVSKVLLDQAKRFREAKGIIVNSFKELETQAIEALSKDSNIPPVYAIGPLLNLKGEKCSSNDSQKKRQEDDDQSIFKWIGSRQVTSMVEFLHEASSSPDANCSSMHSS